MGLVKSRDPLNLGLEVRDRKSQRFKAEEGFDEQEILHTGFGA